MLRGSPFKTLLIVSLALLILLPNPALGKSYYIKEASTEIRVNENGLIKITEKITYGLSGRFFFLSRIIPLRRLVPENLRVSVKGAAASIKKEVYPGKGISITANISDDPLNMQVGVESKDVTLTISYDLKGALNLYQDVAEIFPKLWGEGWEVPLKNLRGEIILPKKASEEVRYWIHPRDYLKSVRLEGERLLLEFENIPPKQFIEARLLLPIDWFREATFARRYNYPALRKIEDIEKGYERKDVFIRVMASLVALIALAIPIAIYIIWGREPKVSYLAPYEHEPPYPDPPSFVNAIMMGKIGVPTLEGFISSVLELIRTGCLRISEDSKGGLIIKLGERSPEGLMKPEREVFEFIKRELHDGEKSWENLTTLWSKSLAFKEFFESWKEIVRWELNPKRFFSATGSIIMRTYGILALVLGLVSLAITISSDQRMFYPKALTYLTMSFGLLSFIGLVSALLPERVGGRWTSFGRLYYMKWEAFKRFLSDFSLLKMHPPSSIAIWDKYLVYATALGVAEKTWKAMKFLVPKEMVVQSSFSPIWHIYPSWMGSLRSSIAEAYAIESKNISGKDLFSGFLGGSGGGIGGIGGGFGGGGGRAG